MNVIATDCYLHMVTWLGVTDLHRFCQTNRRARDELSQIRRDRFHALPIRLSWWPAHQRAYLHMGWFGVSLAEQEIAGLHSSGHQRGLTHTLHLCDVTGRVPLACWKQRDGFQLTIGHGLHKSSLTLTHDGGICLTWGGKPGRLYSTTTLQRIPNTVVTVVVEIGSLDPMEDCLYREIYPGGVGGVSGFGYIRVPK